ncbi:ATP synthase subunit delta mitochondrial [Biomphalaria glabrata]|uniref:ATP synthase F(1) complex subunit delta, mitochondrial n=1 Tax=Biomphalaria glabrata TaxID=6526 RepID=A0A2C9JWT0_BIOGL|nr:ATP synthase subunit delta, mitochondrial-like [Biomphalaria glabrata]KAI8754515.1 ATP synthase subunit delta; mitochondrial-like [Biomphalaria glabrata]KAI8773135.1 ATP synthase subunit delta, mitochondrial [Biomphalaria glabrata]
MASIVGRQLRLTPNLIKSCSRLVTVGQRSYADMAFTFASPYDVYYKDAKVRQIDVPTFSGNFGILPNHVPTLAVLKPGVVNVFEEDGSTKKYFVSSGSVTINDDSSVQILAEEAHPLDRIDASAVREGLTKAQQEVASASSESAKAQAQIAVECYEALQKAVEH